MGRGGGYRRGNLKPVKPVRFQLGGCRTTHRLTLSDLDAWLDDDIIVPSGIRRVQQEQVPRPPVRRQGVEKLDPDPPRLAARILSRRGFHIFDRPILRPLRVFVLPPRTTTATATATTTRTVPQIQIWQKLFEPDTLPYARV